MAAQSFLLVALFSTASFLATSFFYLLSRVTGQDPGAAYRASLAQERDRAWGLSRQGLDRGRYVRLQERYLLLEGYAQERRERRALAWRLALSLQGALLLMCYLASSSLGS